MARRLLWLSALAGLVYVVWRWRSQRAGTADMPEPSLAGPDTLGFTPAPGSADPPLASPSAAADASAGLPRRIPTRVHRGAPPAASPTGDDAPAAQAEPEPPPEPTAPPAATFREVAIGAPPLEAEPADESAEAEPAEVEPAPEDLATLAPPEPAAEAEPAPEDLATLAPPEPAAGAGAADGLVNINTASLEALVALPGIGLALARRIIAYREQRGPFTSVEQLVAIQGIGPRNIDEFRHLVTV